MKILMLADGGSTHTEKWVKELRNEGCEIFLFSLRNLNPILDALAARNELNYFSCDKLISSNASAFQKSTYFKVLPELNRVIKAFKPDIVHAHYASSYGLLALLSCAKEYGVSVWGSDIMQFPNRSWIHRWVLKTILRKASRVWATSKIMLEMVREMAPKSVSSQIPFGVDTDFFKPESNPREKAVFKIGLVKGLAPIYGIDIAIEAFAELRLKFPQMAMEMHVAGDGPQMNELKELAKMYPKEIRFHGRISQKEVPVFIHSLDVFVNISRNESFGVSVLEASSCGVPVVVSDRGGLPETIVPNQTGILLPELNSFHCAQAFEKLMLNPELRKEMGRQGREFVLSNYALKACTQKQVEAYRSWLQVKKGRA